LWKERQLRDYRRANNLCYLCGEKSDAAYLQKCPKRNKPQLNAIALIDLDIELTEEILNHLEIEDASASELGQLSINALSGTENWDSMRIRELVQNKVILILVDSGSSHSFASEAFITTMGIQAVQEPSM
jgi:hypothetical protein